MSNTPYLVRILLSVSALAVVALGLVSVYQPDSELSFPASPGMVAAVDRSAPSLSTAIDMSRSEGSDSPRPRLQPAGPDQASAPPVIPDFDPTTTISTSTTSMPAAPSTTVAGSTTTTTTTTTTTPPSGGGVHEVSGPITIQGESGVVIEGLSISNPDGPCVHVASSSDVTIRNSEIGPCGGWAVFIDGSTNVTVQGTIIRTESGKGGVYGHSSSGVAVLSNTITHSGRNPIQFDKVSGSGNRIEGNSIRTSAAEDMISIYKSGGTSGSWLRVVNNTVSNNTGGSPSGSGIMVGDAGGSFIIVQGNRLTDPGQAGIGVAGGSNVRVLNNTVSSQQLPWSNVGIYVWNQDSAQCHSIEVRGNDVTWLNKDGQANPAWDGGGCGPVAGWDDNSW